MQFKRLRVSGFKSFVDPTELVIEKGLTGIVGPNGCGKSNLLEALRWLMGETRSKSLRGTEMDDVIFAGSSGRPARSFAEVTLLLDNSERTAPAQFNESDELEVSRRIERNMGSAYQINAKDVRQRDVQLLFADNATGAHSPALVSQGKIGHLINAKPTERRLLLEEAAGIAGLHSRRKEAETKLKAAETNLERLNDVVTAMETQSAQLKRQAHQAGRYRILSHDMRQTEAVILYRRWHHTAHNCAVIEQQLRQVDGHVTELTSAAAHAAAQQAHGAAQSPHLRQKEAEAAAALQRLKRALEERDAEEQRITERVAQLERLISESLGDQQREQALADDAKATLTRLQEEAARLRGEQSDIDDRLKKSAEHVAQAQSHASASEQALDSLTQQHADALARKRSLETQHDMALQRLARLDDDIKKLDQEKTQLEAAHKESALTAAILTQSQAEEALKETLAQLATTEALRIEAEASRETLRTEANAARDALRLAAERDIDNVRRSVEQERNEARAHADTIRAQARDTLHEAVKSAQNALQEVQATLVSQKAEYAALERLLASSAETETAPAVLDIISVQAGFENALAAALNDDLTAPTDNISRRRWSLGVSKHPQDPSLPAGVEPLSAYVVAPPALERRLAQIGIVSEEVAPTVLPHLQTGQRLVSVSGHLWRWDGFYAASPDTSSTGERLIQRNRRAVLAEEIIRSEEKLASHEAAYHDVVARETAAHDSAIQQAEAAITKTDADGAARLEATVASTQARILEAHSTLTTALEAANAKVTQLFKEEQSLRTARQQQAHAAETAQRALTTLQTDTARQESRIHALVEAIARGQHDRLAYESDLASIRTLSAALPDLNSLAQDISAQRHVVEEARKALANARAGLESLQRINNSRLSRLTTLDEDVLTWQRRRDESHAHALDLLRRLDDARTEQQDLASRPEILAQERVHLIDHISKAEGVRQEAADALAQADALMQEIDSHIRRINADLLDARETRARLQAQATHQNDRHQEITALISEQFQVSPQDVLQAVGFEGDPDQDPLDVLDAKLERLKHERDRMGALNLLAEQELEEVKVTLERITQERAELIAAIAKLRGAIGALNREGRQRLLKAFEAVNMHFQTLFKTLFGGGEAHLALNNTESEDNERDVLDAGLEIMAAPPGKKIAHMSLLSGGEQALTATALIFAVFLTNPAPICVLDEVDAPLDDANVERFCTLLDAMVTQTKTRFLIVTHNAVTMSRMDRLFGVTMSERGISQLVSVDLKRAETLLAAE